MRKLPLVINISALLGVLLWPAVLYAQTENDPSHWKWIKNISPQSATTGDKIHITMRTPHGGFVHLYAPDKKLYVLSDNFRTSEEAHRGCVQYDFEKFKE